MDSNYFYSKNKYQINNKYKLSKHFKKKVENTLENSKMGEVN